MVSSKQTTPRQRLLRKHWRQTANVSTLNLRSCRLEVIELDAGFLYTLEGWFPISEASRPFGFCYGSEEYLGGRIRKLAFYRRDCRNRRFNARIIEFRDGRIEREERQKFVSPCPYPDQHTAQIAAIDRLIALLSAEELTARLDR